MDQLADDTTRIIDALGPLPAAVARPVLVLLAGLPGSGKSTVADALRRRLPFALLQSDRCRKLLVSAPAYSAEESERVFPAIHRAIERLLRAGVPVIYDATNLTAAYRQPLEEISARTGATLVRVWVEAAEDVIRERLAARQTGHRASYDVSDAGEAVYDLMRARMEPISGPHLIVRSDGDLPAVIERIVRTIARPDGAARDVIGR